MGFLLALAVVAGFTAVLTVTIMAMHGDFTR
jgi:hypothetical protein